ncbi:MAG: exopolyphosphatase [Proteobacteria bacterium]|nr:exopolyphosphatase [Pseudomonadota bacterium]
MSNSNETFAAVDLGSNSFHMVVANVVDGRALIIDRIKEMVRLAGGLEDNGQLTDDAIETALLCLEKFGQRIKTIPASNIRTVGTNAIRQARNGIQFLAKANTALGHNIEIISGREEARLVYLGVANTIFNDKDKRLVIDIGGGSTELIIGKGFETDITESLFIGCVNISQRFFKEGELTAKRFRKARIAALQELQNVRELYRIYGWGKVIGSSGTIRAILDVVIGQGWSDSKITSASLTKLKKALISMGHINKIEFDGLSPNRIPVFVGGVVVLSAVFESLEIESMEYSDGALREGLLYDQIGRQHDMDVRDKTVNRLMNRYSVDSDHADRVEKITKHIFKNIKSEWQLEKKEDLKMIRWAARLHEIGLAIAHSQYHKHGAYLLSNSDMPGFSRQEQILLSILVRSHRRKIAADIFEQLTDDVQNRLIKLIIILRLAIVLNRSRNAIKAPEIDIKINKNKIELQFQDDWLAEHPLTEADLETEAGYLSVTDYKLIFK